MPIKKKLLITIIIIIIILTIIIILGVKLRKPESNTERPIQYLYPRELHWDMEKSKSKYTKKGNSYWWDENKSYRSRTIGWVTTETWSRYLILNIKQVWMLEPLGEEKYLEVRESRGFTCSLEQRLQNCVPCVPSHLRPSSVIDTGYTRLQAYAPYGPARLCAFALINKRITLLCLIFLQIPLCLSAPMQKSLI